MRLLVADYAATRLGVRLALEPEFEICAEAEGVEQAIAAAQRHQPDLCLIGLEIPGGATSAVRGVCEAAPGTAVIVLTAAHDVDDLLAVLRAGAIGYVSGGAEPEQLRRVVRAVNAGEAVVPRAMVLELVRELQSTTGGSEGLTTREAQVLGMLRRGQSTAAIADRLGISPVTVRRHISALMQKTGATDRTALAGVGAHGAHLATPNGVEPVAAPA